MKTLICAVLLVVATTGNAQESATQEKVEQKVEQKESEKQADIRRLLKVTGAGEIGKQVAMQLIGQFKATNPNIPQKFWDEFAKELSSDELVALTIPAYDKHLSHDDIKQLIAFYESPVGKKLVKVQPQIMQDSMMAGQKWGRELSEKVVRRLIAEGFQPGPGGAPRQ